MAAAALVVAAVFFVNDNAPPASADHGATATAWSATLTLQDIGSGDLGCLNDLSDSAKKCSTATTLTDDEFELPDADVSIRAIFLSSLGLDFYPTNTAERDALQAHTLFVDGVPFRFANTSRVTGTAGLRWASPGLTWSAGDTVRLRLTVDTSQINLPTLTASMSTDPVQEDWETDTANDLWNATLTVRDLGTTGSAPAKVGCDDSNSSARCISALTDRDFTFDGVSYTVEAISYNQRKVAADIETFQVKTYEESLTLKLNKAIPESLQSCLTLYAGNARIRLADDGVPGAGVDTALTDSNSTLTLTEISGLAWGMNWSAGQTVNLRLPNVGCLTLTLSEAVDAETSPQWRRGGTADLSGDYQRISLPTFANGSMTASTPVKPVDDSEAEGCETIILAMTMWPGEYWAVHDKFTFAIQDDDGGNACVGGG